jgi:peptidoglycan L-alanyl-D-glutamate endopeptidase CwlK
MAKLGAGSLAVRAELDPALQRVFDRVVALLTIDGRYDIKLLDGWRSHNEQLAAYKSGKSQKKPGTSKHESWPARAVDAALYPVDFGDELGFAVLAGFVFAAAALEGVKIRWGGDWNQNGETDDEGFPDLNHFELA